MAITTSDPGEFEHTDSQFWLRTVALAAALGLLVDLLFNGAALGANVPLWLGALIATFVLMERRRRPIAKQTLSLLAGSFALSTMVVWRSAAELQIVPLVASMALLLLALVTRNGDRTRRPSITYFLLSLVTGARSAATGIVRLPRSIGWRSAVDQEAREQGRRVARAMLIAVPLLLLFGGLFVAADAVFESWIRSSLSFDLAAILRHLGWIVGGTVAAAGLLWSGLGTDLEVPPDPELSEGRRLQSVETGVVLGSLTALFAVFVAIQAQYLFGGSEHVQSSIGLTYADYARRGFFELVAVALFLLPVLLALDWSRARSGRSLTTFRVLSTLLVVLLVVVMASAMQRLRIYIDTFGLTALRFYAAALLVWLGAVFGWLLWSLLRERRNEFVAGTVLTGMLAIVMVVAVNPHGLITTTNLSRAEDGREFDVSHALGLSADATPTLIDGIEALPEEDACEIARTVLARWGEPDSQLRSWNWGRVSAAAAVEANRADLTAACS